MIMTESTRNANDPFALQPEAIPNPDLTLVPPSVPAEPAASETTQPPMGWMLLRELVETVVLSLVIFLLIRQVVQNYRIESHSMQPNFQEGQFILVNKLAYKLGTPERGEVIVFHNPRNTDEDYIKRVIGLPGDTVEIRNEQVFINNQPLDEPFAKGAYTDPNFAPVVVAPNQLFVMGDNRGNSQDSRVIGAISEDLVVGQAWLRVWPFSVFGLVPHYQLEPGVPAATSAVIGAPPTAGCCATDSP
jgi:signal peptidase I